MSSFVSSLRTSHVLTPGSVLRIATLSYPGGLVRISRMVRTGTSSLNHKWTHTKFTPLHDHGLLGYFAIPTQCTCRLDDFLACQGVWGSQRAPYHGHYTTYYSPSAYDFLTFFKIDWRPKPKKPRFRTVSRDTYAEILVGSGSCCGVGEFLCSRMTAISFY